ncbi:transcriptional regulator [Erwinia piriflorinigrans]|uniref:Transcriptional regulatory protein glnR n=1 Tax=Erwinia piriflorinigrans CFBP 5888 TaxID=1161919 RepID=V5Z6V9_9GAMM|nr:winged helix-turn-helix domain-containing protein [Erwinia piriflorinigrans]CCG87056.1 Transcriptional regulatory protein glnR [Erwinia piriflorinigrans CFBP 5888]
MDDSKIYFLDFTFNPKTRSLQKSDSRIQLRKKQADVLNLLCAKYPEPVSREDFLAGAWDGGYVTTQSIAQVIRSLRLNLDDSNKKIIVTIPKLGYRFTVQPLYKEPVISDISYRKNAHNKDDINQVYAEELPGDAHNPVLSGTLTEKTNISKKKKIQTEKLRLLKKFFYSTTLIVATLFLFFFI